jgi:stress response protein SCP2
VDALIIQRTLRVPAVRGGTPGEIAPGSATVARQMDAALIQAGFKATGALLAHISMLDPDTAFDRALVVIGAVRELLGDHVAHNVYFKDFPNNVPDAEEFWIGCLRQALVRSQDDLAGEPVMPTDAELRAFVGSGLLNLLALPTYGSYQHSYADMLAAHTELIPSVKDRVTLLHLGQDIEEETGALYRALAASPTPLGEADLPVLEMLAAVCVQDTQPETIPVRENRAAINAVRLAAGADLVGVDTVTDVLRLACQVSDGDVTLRQRTRFRSFTRAERLVLMAALNRVVGANQAKLGDVRRFARRWQRLGERIHPGDTAYEKYPNAQDVFAVARGDRAARSLAAKVELALAEGDVEHATRRLAGSPGLLMRSLDRLLRAASGIDEPYRGQAIDDVLGAVEATIGAVSGRVLLSVREHLYNRDEPQLARMFTHRGRRAWVTPDARPPLSRELIDQAAAVLDAELVRRLPDRELIVEADMLRVAVPLSGTATEDGFGVLPRGSVHRVRGDTLRLFTYWRQAAESTDYDLSAVFYDEHFEKLGLVDYTSTRFADAVHSGDIVDATDGASEFIDVPLAAMAGAGVAYIVPQVNIFRGEDFDTVAESMIGFMSRDSRQQGAPFEPATVRTRSALRGPGRVALPMAFLRDGDGSWVGKYMHLNMAGHLARNQASGNYATTGLLAQSVLRRRYLTVNDLVTLWAHKAGAVTVLDADGEVGSDRGACLAAVAAAGTPVTYIGVTAPEQPLPDGSAIVTPASLNQLVPL